MSCRHCIDLRGIRGSEREEDKWGGGGEGRTLGGQGGCTRGRGGKRVDCLFVLALPRISTMGLASKSLDDDDRE